MYLKQTSLIFLFYCLTMVWACDTACSSTGERNGKCYYSCSEGTCHMTANHHQHMFLEGLSQHGYQCRGIGVSGVECDKTSNFGGCYEHRWTCGKC
ncbi:hypothetical protein BCR42DRAFT_452342 [Absidia repens]|uniref:Secreted protein n=1 Tax=Absidia repens TaxID=90262 RepID=A0A1X2IDJ8_9FUNG|nr:hypothetical protein BCR42DRAFT_452342 [Absidia repens]